MSQASTGLHAHEHALLQQQKCTMAKGYQCQRLYITQVSTLVHAVTCEGLWAVEGLEARNVRPLLCDEKESLSRPAR